MQGSPAQSWPGDPWAWTGAKSHLQTAALYATGSLLGAKGQRDPGAGPSVTFRAEAKPASREPVGSYSVREERLWIMLLGKMDV